MSLALRHYNQSRIQSSARPPSRTVDGDEEVIRHADRQPPWKASLPVAKNIIFNQLHLVSHSCSGVSQWKYTFGHSTLTLYIFKSLRGRIMHFIVSICLIAVVPMPQFRPRTQRSKRQIEINPEFGLQMSAKFKLSNKPILYIARYLLLVFK